jgi:hypothetical protein
MPMMIVAIAAQRKKAPRIYANTLSGEQLQQDCLEQLKNKNRKDDV